MSKTFKELEQVNYESALFALAHGVDYEQLGDIMDEALEVEEYEVVAGIERAIITHSETGDYNCIVRPIVDESEDEELDLPEE
tara:strand:- start:35 stop:283 length:249 start_codon:yes stop_codon:yes gene_type:complete